MNPKYLRLVSIYEQIPELFLNLTKIPKIAPFGPKKTQTRIENKVTLKLRIEGNKLRLNWAKLS